MFLFEVLHGETWIKNCLIPGHYLNFDAAAGNVRVHGDGRALNWRCLDLNIHQKHRHRYEMFSWGSAGGSTCRTSEVSRGLDAAPTCFTSSWSSNWRRQKFKTCLKTHSVRFCFVSLISSSFVVLMMTGSRTSSHPAAESHDPTRTRTLQL